MSRLTPGPVPALLARARSINELAGKKTHPQVRNALQRAYGGLVGTADVLTEIFRVAGTIADDAANKKKRSVGATALGAARLSVVLNELPGLVVGAELLGTGRDVELYKLLGKRSIILAASMGARMSGVAYIKDAADILGALKEVAETGQAVKLRRDQVRAASDLLRWADAIATLGIERCYAAEDLLLRIGRRGRQSENAVVDRMVKRIAKGTRSWEDPE